MATPGGPRRRRSRERSAQPQAVKQAAIAALSSGQQNARIAGDELRSISQALGAVYPVVDAATGPVEP